VRRGLAHAIAAGELLIEAKAQLKHGQWGPWLAEHCAIPDRTARLYVRLARNRPALEQNGNVADLSLRGAVEMLTPRADPLTRIEKAKAEMQSLKERQSQPDCEVHEQAMIWRRIFELTDVMLEAAVEDKLNRLAAFAASGEYRLLPKGPDRRLAERWRQRFCDENGAIDHAKLNAAIEDCSQAVLRGFD
jgi:hypothetical protein